MMVLKYQEKKYNDENLKSHDIIKQNCYRIDNPKS